ncbi:hypothetical protein [Membranihabitans marinus]|uniref:hypothetical protein n=1 Tax=Membranihabitans marinus TaxID=1227546 RepID=UPI001F30C29D|nr:hypothetical protein [Membranihabitans marinus]
MKIFYSEFVKDYSSYTFSYAPYAIYEPSVDFSEIYANGFLPYTGNIELNHYLYYMARSIRISLKDFAPSSENRRVGRKFEAYTFEKTLTPIADFDIENEEFLKFCSDYGAARFKGGAMPVDRLLYILRSPLLTHILTYSYEGENLGYIFLCKDDKMMHYWFSFFSLTEFSDLPLGKYLMLETILYGQEQSLDYCYLGTCYGQHSLYKVRDFKAVEYSEGQVWSSDVKTLKLRCKADDEAVVLDAFKKKDADEANRFLEELIDSK